MTIQNIKAKTLVRKSYPSTFAWMNYTLNPYQGCFHNCGYCDGKSERYRMHENFSRVIKVKDNAPDLLARFFRNKGYYDNNADNNLFKDIQNSKKADFILFIGGGVCDVYQPAEEKVRLNRKLLQLAYDYGIPVHLLTKNKLVLEDLDIIKKINAQSYAGVHFTITLADDAKQAIFEPGASSSSERFQAIKKFRQQSIPCGVYLLPVLPFIGDSDENMLAIFNQAKMAEAQFIYCSGLTLKPGRNKDEFLQTIDKHFPEYLDQYKLLYDNNNKYGQMNYNQFYKMKLIRPELCAYKLSYEIGLDYVVPRYIPEGRIKNNLRASEILLRAAWLHRNILGSYHTARDYEKAAYILEDFSSDILTLSKQAVLNLEFHQDVNAYLSELFIQDHSEKLSSLEKQAYSVALSKIQKAMDLANDY